MRSYLPIIGLLAAACSPTPNSPPGLESTGAALSIDYLGNSDVVGFAFVVEAVECDTGAPVIGGPDPIEETVDLVDGIFPGNITFVESVLHPESRHLGADLFVSLDPDFCYLVHAQPLSGIAPDIASSDCAPVSTPDPIEVIAEQTTEAPVLVSQCVGDPIGALDQLVVLNHPPTIDVWYTDDKFNHTCEAVEICFRVEDVDNDPVVIEVSQVHTDDPLGDSAIDSDADADFVSLPDVELFITDTVDGHHVWEGCTWVETAEPDSYQVLAFAYDVDANGQPFDLAESSAQIVVPVHTLQDQPLYIDGVPEYFCDETIADPDMPMLASLALSVAPLDAPFEENVLSYSSFVNFMQDSTSVTVVPAEPGSAIRINGAPATPGVPTDAITLLEGSNVLVIDVDSPDAELTTTYLVEVERGSADAFAQQAYLKAHNTGAIDRFGYSVALSHDTLVVGAAHEDSNATGIDGDGANNGASSSGGVHVFHRADGTWSQQAYIKASNTNSGDRFGVSVSIDGDTLAVGAYIEGGASTGIDGDPMSNAAPGSGAVYVFERTAGTWLQSAYVKPHNTDAGDFFGYRVAIHADTLVVGAYGEDSASSGVDGDAADNTMLGAGAAYVFARDGGTWAQQAYLKASNPDALARFGFSVAVHGDTVAVGAQREDSGSSGINGTPDESLTDAGAVYVFTRTGESWAQQAYIKASNPDARDYFGTSVALHGDTLAVGAIGEDSSANTVDGNQTNDSLFGAGAAYVFTRTGSDWAQGAYIKAANAGVFDYFGISVALHGNKLAVGAHIEDGGSSGTNNDDADDSRFDAGAVYLFANTSGTWSQRAYVKAGHPDAFDFFGYGVALSADTLAVSAYGEDSSATGVNGDETNNAASASGAAYVFH